MTWDILSFSSKNIGSDYCVPTLAVAVVFYLNTDSSLALPLMLENNARCPSIYGIDLFLSLILSQKADMLLVYPSSNTFYLT